MPYVPYDPAKTLPAPLDGPHAAHRAIEETIVADVTAKLARFEEWHEVTP